ncbi:MAG TPA: hypothetical protein VFP38_11675, partial [Bradyrhizobium sp.]|nr:hypothetical protein [Bradyrhizobium sp.]
GATALCLALPGAITTLGNSAYAGGTLEERKQPMQFKWVACQPDCKGWVSAVGIVTADSPTAFAQSGHCEKRGDDWCDERFMGKVLQ